MLACGMSSQGVSGVLNELQLLACGMSSQGFSGVLNQLQLLACGMSSQGFSGVLNQLQLLVSCKTNSLDIRMLQTNRFISIETGLSLSSSPYSSQAPSSLILSSGWLMLWQVLPCRLPQAEIQLTPYLFCRSTCVVAADNFRWWSGGVRSVERTCS